MIHCGGQVHWACLSIYFFTSNIRRIIMGAKIGALWKNQSRDNKTPFLSGAINAGLLGQIRVVVFKNELKENGKEPDYHILLSDPPEKPEDEDF
jgi:uncharacterized protein (DUF736 family)